MARTFKDSPKGEQKKKRVKHKKLKPFKRCEEKNS